ncbi:MAG TPA: FxsA family protein [Pseudolabrys sp.]|nr:FxsA family protein [Pseudolabrys sp.]
MNVAKWVILAVLALPILELAAFIAVVATIGFGWALSLILAGSLCGALILRHAGSGHAARIRVALDRGSFAALQTDADGGPVLLAGILLLIPGFITDIVALVLLVGSLRRAFVGVAPRQEDGVVDLAPEQWHQVPDPSLPDHRKDERRH